ncbi:MAG: alanine racemase [Planctomycetes bacterium]|nr:alanine racemase [Planctomycetota bacterium]
MNRLTIDLEALRHNIRVIDEWVLSHNASWTMATKVLCGHKPSLLALQHLGIRSMADSRMDNLSAIRELPDPTETWYLRLPHMTAIPEVIRLSDVSLNSETEVIVALNEEAKRQGKVHRIIIMLELGDLREGVLPGSLVSFYEHIFDLPNIEVLGIGSNLGCLSGAIPSIDQFAQLSLYHELLELKFGRSLPLISAGTSAALPLLRDGILPPTINHFRIGDSVYLGTDLLNGGTLEGLRDDAITLEVEVAELKEKGLRATGETTDMMPFEALPHSSTDPGQRGYRAVVTVGQLDTVVGGLTPLEEEYEMVGASSDLSVVNLGDNPRGVKVGDTLSFRPSYGAFVRLMMDPYIDKVLVSREQAREALKAESSHFDVPPILDGLESGDPPGSTPAEKSETKESCL